jgi:hypothetical protein
MKIFVSLMTFIALISVSFLDVNKYNIIILPKDKLNTQFSIIGSVSRADSINDQYARPLYNNLQNQYYFKEFNNHIIIMQPNIGIKYNGSGINDAIDDKIIYRLTKYLSFYNYVIFDINPLIKKNFFYKINRRKYFTETNINTLLDNKVINIDINYYDKTVTYSLFFHEESKYKSKISNLKHGYFITLANTYNNNGSKLDHLITRWDCKNPINIYIDESVPLLYLSVFKDGIEEWNNAFKNTNIDCNIKGITYKDNEWNNFKYGDARYSTISLSPSSLDATYAIGHINFDWRNGKIFRGNIMVSSKWINYWANVYNYLNNIKKINYNKTSKVMCINDNLLENTFEQTDFIKKGLKSVIIHEMGHILGLRHNFKASSLIEYNEIFDKCRILKDGLIPSIMDYLSYIININNIYKCVDNKCIFDNVEIMDTIGRYDKQTIQFGYGDFDTMEYYLGPDEFNGNDPLSNTGDISNIPTRYYEDDLLISKYVISNYYMIHDNNNKNFNSNWKNEGKLLISHINKITKYIRDSINTLMHISYSFDGNIIDIKKTQYETIKFIKNIADGKFFIQNRKYFVYDDCDIRGNYYCQGMASFDLLNVHEKILTEIQMILNSYDFKEIIDKNHIITNKTIPFSDIVKIFSN